MKQTYIWANDNISVHDTNISHLGHIQPSYLRPALQSLAEQLIQI